MQNPPSGFHTGILAVVALEADFVSWCLYVLLCSASASAALDEEVPCFVLLTVFVASQGVAMFILKGRDAAIISLFLRTYMYSSIAL